MIEHYDLEVVSPPCEPGAERLTAIARLSVDISELLPYLNATLSGASFFPEAKALIWKDEYRSVAFHPYEIAVSDVDDRDDAVEALDDLIDLVNRTWERRAEIVPSITTRRRPTPLAVYQLLPGIDCKDCGEPTCWNFALKLVTGQKRTADCPELSEPRYASNLAELLEIVV